MVPRSRFGGTDQSGPAPFTAKLENGKSYKVRVTARGFYALEIDVRGGDPKQIVKLVAKARVIAVASDPPGARILVDGLSIEHITPFDVELTAQQASRKSVRIGLRKPGFRALDRTFDLTELVEDDFKMSAKLYETLTR